MFCFFNTIAGGPEPDLDIDGDDDGEDDDVANGAAKYMSLSDMMDASADVVKPTSTSNGIIEEDDEEEYDDSDDEDMEDDSDASDGAADVYYYSFVSRCRSPGFFFCIQRRTVY